MEKKQTKEKTTFKSELKQTGKKSISISISISMNERYDKHGHTNFDNLIYDGYHHQFKCHMVKKKNFSSIILFAKFKD